MARFRLTQTNFAGGELDPRLAGRTDLRAYASGAARLRNVVIHPGGGVSRRPGLRHVAATAGDGRLIAFSTAVEPACLLVLTDRHLAIYREGAPIASLATPWTEDQLRQLNWTQGRNALLVVHPDVPPHEIAGDGGGHWQVTPQPFKATADGRIRQPHRKFTDDAVTVAASTTAAGATAVLTASQPVFAAAHVGTRLRLRDRELEVVGHQGPTALTVLIRQPLIDTQPTREWTEQAFSAVRGWPVSVTFHQDRLVIGGSRGLPNRLWLSRTGEPFDFDQGTGLDDQAIEFPLLSDQGNAIRAVVSGRHLQVFTTGAEWMVTGSPLTPSTVQVHRQTRVGSPDDRTVPPADVDGATCFVPRHDGQLREFLYTDVEQAYQATDLALASAHLVKRPRDMDYDPRHRLLHVVMDDGTIGSLTAYRAESIAAWSLQETAGRFLSVAVVDDAVYVLIDRSGQVSVEVFDHRLNLDAAIRAESDVPQQIWPGLDHLDGSAVTVVADGALREDTWLAGGAIELTEPAGVVEAGLPYAHVITPLPVGSLGNGVSAVGTSFRPTTLSFRLHETQALRVDVGSGPIELPFRQFGRDTFGPRPLPFTGVRSLSLLGWRKGGADPLWSIQQATPLPFTLLSATIEGIGSG
ncbi:MAG: hypothetical protein EA406_09865 [Rhodospirillales bacterium]|nr:MAG: hypothetical protein EA406_09865 [Rhodospirillales bacterium]